MVPPILEGVLSQPDDVHVQVAFTSVQLLAELNEWIACHPNLLPHVLQFLTKRLHNKHLATVAAKVGSVSYVVYYSSVAASPQFW